MDANVLAKEMIEHFGEDVACVARSFKRLYVTFDPDELYPVWDWLQEKLPGLRFGTSTAMDLRQGIGVFHHLPVNGTPLVITLKVIAAKPDPRVPALTVKVPAAGWIEREMTDLVGVIFEGHPEPHRLVKAEAFPDTFPLRRDFDPERFKEDIGELPDF
ncbi:MAG: NADH-quinone oxidoreductase subunit C [Planctomycetota bacterium]|nr:NADH-quinone oxidoreductase subunit C [Planctomycetota bacterium]